LALCSGDYASDEVQLLCNKATLFNKTPACMYMLMSLVYAAGRHSSPAVLSQPAQPHQLPLQQQPTVTLQRQTASLQATWRLQQHQALLLLTLCLLALEPIACCSASS
jgi:hypothetical protein